MNNLKSVSVIVPVFNASATLLPTLISLLEQTLEQIEIIIVDDASTDSSGDIIKKIAAENDNIVVISFIENKGVHEARLAGIKHASAAWIGFMDADDLAEPDMFKLMYNTAIRKNVDIALCGSYRTDGNGKATRKRAFFKKNQYIDSNIFERFCSFEFGDGALWNKLYKSQILKELNFDDPPWRQNINEDLIMNIGAFYRAESLYLMKDILHNSVAHSGSVTARQNNFTAYVNTFRAYALALHTYRSFDAESLFNITSLYRKQFDDLPYRVDDLKFLNEHNSIQIIEAVTKIQNSYPQGLGLICCRSMDITNLPIKYLAKSLINKILTRICMLTKKSL